MGNLKVLHKGAYPFPRDNDYVRLIQYIIVEEDGEKYALLRFVNDDKSAVKGLKIKFEQVGADGETVTSGVYECGELNVKSKQKFAFGKKIKIDKDCFDFKVKVLFIDFGKFVYNAVGANKGLSYVKSESGKRAHAGAYALKEKKLRISSILSMLFCGVMLAAAAAVTISVNNYKATEDGFVLQNVNYTFVDGDKEGDVVVTGYRGKASRVDIPEKAGGRNVVKIDEYAFRGKNTVNRVVIKGAPVIEEGAFYNCSGLQKIELGGVTNIGDKAFYGCVSLKSVNSDKLTSVGASAFARCESLESVSVKHDGVINIGEKAFENCRKLNDVNLDCFIDYSNSGAGKFFNGCGAIGKMYLKNYNYSEYGYLSSDGGYAALFSGSTVRVDGAADLTVEYTDGIFSSMLGGDKILKTFTVKDIGNADIAEKAFYDCKNLTAINLPLSPTLVGGEAFANTNLTDFDFSKVTAINKKAFSGCEALMSDLQNAAFLTEIGENAFENCASVKKVYLSPTVIRLGAGAFSGCKSLREVNGLNKTKISALEKSVFEGCESLLGAALPQGVSSIGTAAFKNCKSITDFVAPESLVSVSDEAFSGCAALKSFDLKNNIEVIGACAFAGCTSIEEITINASVKTIGAGAFAGDESLLSLTLPDFRNAATLKTLFTNDSALEIPKSLKTVTLTSVESLQSRAFEGAEAVEEVKIEGDYDNNITELFLGAVGLKRLTLPYFYTASDWFGGECNLETVSVTDEKKIQSGAFAGCVKLKSVNYAQELSYIGSNAFNGCVRLEKFYLPENTPNIDSNAFNGCYKLYEVVDKSGNVKKGETNYGGIAYYAVKVYSDEKDAPAKVNKDGYKLLFDEDISKWLYASYEGSATELTFPAEIVDLNGETVDTFRVADYLLYNEREITSVTFGNIDYLGKYSLYGCVAVTNVAFGSGSTFKAVNEYAFYGCTSLIEAKVPSVEKVEGYAFYGCDRLETASLTLNEAVGEYAFGGCVRLHEVKNEGTLTLEAGSSNNGEIARYAIAVYTDFSKGLAVKTVNDVKFKSDDGDTWYATSFDGKGVANIGISDVNEIVIAPYAFESADNVTKVVTDRKLTKIGEKALYNCQSLESLDLSASNNLTELKSGVFTNCTGLKTIVLPKNLTSIPRSVFDGCLSVENLTVPIVGEASSIGYLFGVDNCSLNGLKTVTVNGGTSIASYAFSGLNSIETIKFSSSVESAGDYAFYDLKKLTSIDLGGVKSLGEYAFKGCSQLKNIKLPRDLTAVSAGLFEECASLSKVTFPSKLTEIGKNAFASDSLTSVDLSGTSVRSIGDYAFYDNKVLTEVKFPNTLDTIGDYAFTATALNELSLASTNVGYIGKEAFKELPLTKASFPSTLNNVGNDAFYGCVDLIQVNDLSYRLTKGSRDFGYAAYYAVYVFNTISGNLTLVNLGNAKFAKDNRGYWYLYYYFDNLGDTIILPESFVNGSQTVTEYAIHKYAFRSSVAKIVIRSGVTAIDADAFASAEIPSVVYYEGTSSQWSSLTKPNNLSTVYYYDKCAHEGNQWKFVYGEPFVGPFDVTAETGEEISNKAPTCTEDGYVIYRCKVCKSKTSARIVIPKLGHKLKHYPAKAPTEEESGNIEYWYCERCEKYFKDKYGKTEITKRDTRVE